MVRVPWLDQEWEALVNDDQSEYDPSPQSKRYWRLWPMLEDAPPVEKVRLSPTSPLDGPVGVFGVLTVSPGSDMVTV